MRRELNIAVAAGILSVAAVGAATPAHATVPTPRANHISTNAIAPNLLPVPPGGWANWPPLWSSHRAAKQWAHTLIITDTIDKFRIRGYDGKYLVQGHPTGLSGCAPSPFDQAFEAKPDTCHPGGN